MKVALCILDGCNTAAFEKVVNRQRNDSFFGPLKSGFYAHSVTSFPTVTAPEHATLMTGCYPIKHGIAGMKWYDRESGEHVDYYFIDNLETGNVKFTEGNILDKIWLFIRSLLRRKPLISFLAGLKDFALDLNGKHLSNNVQTIFEALDGSSTTSFKEFIHRGTDDFIMSSIMELLLKEDHADFQSYLRINYPEPPKFIAYWKAGTDTKSHKYGPGSKQLEREIEKGLSRARDLVEFYLGQGEEILLAITADHAQSAVSRFPNFTTIFSRYGLKVDKYEEMSDQTDAMLVNNGRMFYLYLMLEEDRQTLIDRFVNILKMQSSVDLIFFVNENNEIIVVEADTNGTECELNNYPWDDKKYPSTDERFDGKLIYPNAPTRIENIIRSKRAGDIIVSMKEGYSSHKHKGDHGSLMAKDSVVPLLIHKFVPNSSVSDPPTELRSKGLMPNSVDVAPTLVKLLGYEHKKVDGKPIEKVIQTVQGEANNE